MSNAEADELWRNVTTMILQQVEIERQNAVGAKDNPALLQRYYLTFLECYRNLERCYALHTHPQKRIVIKQALDAIVGRLLETRQLLMQLRREPFPDMFNILQDGSLLPRDVQVPPPRFATTDNAKLLDRNYLTKLIIDKYEVAKYNGSLFDTTHSMPRWLPGCGYQDEQEQEQKGGMTLQDAILLIQRAERGRNARVRANLFKNLQKSRQDAAMTRDAVVNREEAAIVIQKNWRAVISRRDVGLMKQARLVFLGLANYSTVGGSLIPIINTMVDKSVIRREADLQKAQHQQVLDKAQWIDDMLFSHGRQAKDVGLLPHQVQLSYAPLGTASDPQTCDPFESQYGLCRQIDKINIIERPDAMKPFQFDSAICMCPDPIKQRILRQTARYLLSPAYQNVLAEHSKTAVARMNAQMLKADKKLIKQQVIEEEAEELRQNLRRRHWEAIEAKIQRAQTGADDAGANKAPVLSSAVEYPQVPLEIRTADEADLMAQVAAARQRKIDALKKKKGKPKKVVVDEGSLDEVTKAMSAFTAPLVDAAIEYFVRWQRTEGEAGEGNPDGANPEPPYNADYVKELYRPKVYEKVFQEVYDEVQAELEQIAKNAALINAMGGKKKAKMPKKPKKPKAKKGAVYVKPDPVGPVGDPEQEAAYAEMVSEGVVKVIKPATFDDVVVSEKVMAPGDREAMFLQDQAKKFLGGGQAPKQEEAPAEGAPAPVPPVPSYGTIVDWLMCSVVLPLATPTLRAPVLLVDRPTRVLLFGAPGSGKTLLSRCIATHLGALFIDLSPANLYNKFPASEMQFLFAKLKQFVFNNTPAVIYIDEVELIVPAGKAGGKKGKGGGGDDQVTPGMTMNAPGYPKTMDKAMAPDRLKKELVKFLKLCTKESGVVLIGNATRTFGREKALSSMFDQLVYLPLPDYSMRLRLLSHFFARMGLEHYGLSGVAKDTRCLEYAELGAGGAADVRATPLGLAGLQKALSNTGVGAGRFLDLGALARACDGLTAGQIEAVVAETLPAARVAALAARPLDVCEFIPALQRQEPHFDSAISHNLLFGMNAVPQPPVVVEAKK